MAEYLRRDQANIITVPIPRLLCPIVAASLSVGYVEKGNIPRGIARKICLLVERFTCCYRKEFYVCNPAESG